MTFLLAPGIEGLMTSINILKDEIVNMKKIIIKKLQDDSAMLANKIVELEDKMNNLEI